MKSILFALALLSSSVFASECSNLYPNNEPIVVFRATELCNSFYVSVFDTQTKAVLFTSELLKHGAPVGSQKRHDSFRSDDRIANSPANHDYRGTGFDRGHMAPSDDASTKAEMYDTFLLTNMTPQVPSLNRQAWKRLEEKVRKIFDNAKSDVYVLTIAVYDCKPTKKMNNIPIPTGYWKVVYVDGTQKFFYAPNIPHGKVVQKTSVDLKTLIK